MRVPDRHGRGKRNGIIFDSALIITGAVLSGLISAAWNVTLFKKKLILIALALLIALVSWSIRLLLGFANKNDERAEKWLQSIGLPADLHFEKIASGSGNYHKVLLGALEPVGEGDKILILTWHRIPNRHQKELEKREESRQEYLDLLLTKAG
jgi:hypothetical protein